MDKYIVQDKLVVVALKFDTHKSKLTIGGYEKFRHFIECLIEEYFKKVAPTEPDYTQKNKIRFVIPVKRKKFLKVINRLEEEGFSVTLVNSLQRIMR